MVDQRGEETTRSGQLQKNINLTVGVIEQPKPFISKGSEQVDNAITDFSNKIIERNISGRVNSNRDLKLCNIFFEVYIKSLAYKNNPKSIPV